MHLPTKLGLVILLVVAPIMMATSEQAAVEICDNGIDDDNNGKIDLNDETCFCEPLEQESLIPNPSFEEQDCCPDVQALVNCATGWMQVTRGTPDYFHACDYDGADIYDLPPIPDGDGFIGIIDGVFTGNFLPALKEYAGICLSTPTIPNVRYRLEFYTGFLDKRTSPDIEIALFGTTNCTNIPIDLDDTSFGCPSNSPDWVFLGSANTSGENQWQKSQFKFQTDLPIAAVAIGPSCRLRSSTNNTYHLLDQLILKENERFDLGIEARGEPCTNDLVFEIRNIPETQYQWYKDGIAIVGATESSLRSAPGQGHYQVRLTNAEGCKISKPYIYAPSKLSAQTTQVICQGEHFSFNDQLLTEPGVYLDTLTSIHSCDSIVQLELQVLQPIQTEILEKVFPGEAFTIGSLRFDTPGEYMHTIPSSVGCDSTVLLQLEHYGVYVPDAFSPNQDGVNDDFSIQGNTDLESVPLMQVFDRYGGLMFEGIDLATGEGWNGTIDGENAQQGVYVYLVEVRMNDGRQKSFTGSLTLVR